jgi:hypothetical protein
MIDFVNLKIKSVQSFRCAHKNRIYVHRYECSYMYEYLYLYCISKKCTTHENLKIFYIHKYK